MGYTNYWKFSKKANETDFTKAKQVIRNFIKFAVKKGYVLANGTGETDTKPCVSAATIHFNGVGEDSHESVYIHPTLADMWGDSCSGSGFNFCKTARKSYDPIVVGVLLILKDVMGNTIEIASDGFNANPEYDYQVSSCMVEGFKLYADFWQLYSKVVKHDFVSTEHAIRHAIEQFVSDEDNQNGFEIEKFWLDNEKYLNAII